MIYSVMKGFARLWGGGTVKADRPKKTKLGMLVDLDDEK